LGRTSGVWGEKKAPLIGGESLAVEVITRKALVKQALQWGGNLYKAMLSPSRSTQKGGRRKGIVLLTMGETILPMGDFE